MPPSSSKAKSAAEEALRPAGTEVADRDGLANAAVLDGAEVGFGRHRDVAGGHLRPPRAANALLQRRSLRRIIGDPHRFHAVGGDATDRAPLDRAAALRELDPVGDDAGQRGRRRGPARIGRNLESHPLAGRRQRALAAQRDVRITLRDRQVGRVAPEHAEGEVAGGVGPGVLPDPHAHARQAAGIDDTYP